VPSPEATESPSCTIERGAAGAAVGGLLQAAVTSPSATSAAMTVAMGRRRHGRNRITALSYPMSAAVGRHHGPQQREPAGI
jgi:hypothetical protein